MKNKRKEHNMKNKRKEHNMKNKRKQHKYKIQNHIKTTKIQQQQPKSNNNNQMKSQKLNKVKYSLLMLKDIKTQHNCNKHNNNSLFLLNAT